MTTGGGGAGTGADLSIGPALEQLRRDNNLLSVMHDPFEDGPRIVGIPAKFQAPDDSPTPDAVGTPEIGAMVAYHRWRAAVIQLRICVAVTILAGIGLYLSLVLR